MTDESSDEAIVSQSLGGDPHAFALLVDRYQSRILGTASRFARNRHELEDLSQDIFLKAWKGLPTFKATAPFEHWLMRLAVRVCYDFLRKNRRFRENEVSREVVNEKNDRLTEESVENADLDAGEAREVLQHAMETLNPKDQLVLTLKELENRSVREIADLTGWSISNVKVRAMRARNRLKANLIELGYGN
ncbi:MAG: sigma-70 family RNA polymerase sigma factor [Verrucomicrobiota bacterium]